jgi:hypothetical protein
LIHPLHITKNLQTDYRENDQCAYKKAPLADVFEKSVVFAVVETRAYFLFA